MSGSPDQTKRHTQPATGARADDVDVRRTGRSTATAKDMIDDLVETAKDKVQRAAHAPANGGER